MARRRPTPVAEDVRRFRLASDYAPAGDQPAAIAALCENIGSGLRYQTLLGATGTISDITQRREAEAALRAAHEKMIRRHEHVFGEAKAATPAALAGATHSTDQPMPQIRKPLIRQGPGPMRALTRWPIALASTVPAPSAMSLSSRCGSGSRSAAKSRKVSKVDTLRCAVEYIRNLERLLATGGPQHHDQDEDHNVAASAANLAAVSSCGLNLTFRSGFAPRP